MAGIQPYQPSSGKPWDKRRVIHLYRRLGMGPTPAQIQAGLNSDPLALIDSLLIGTKNKALPSPPIWANYTAKDYENTDNLKFIHRDEFFDAMFDEMLSDGVRSQLVLFWHNHFVTELDVYDCNNYLWNYYTLLHKYCLGNFKQFVIDMGKSPAMLVYLNGNQNEVGQPNENYARELMELFTMGENNGYTQTDVVEVSKALTGWRCNMYECTSVSFANNKFDNSEKTIFGKKGKWNYNDVHDLIFNERKNQVAQYICGKFYAHFIHQKVDQEFVLALAEIFINSNWEILPVMQALFKSDHFFDDGIIGSVIKSPINCMIELARLSGTKPINIRERYGTFRYGSDNLGMEILNPINVAGWPGHHDWINENTLTQRWNYCREIINTFTNDKNREDLRAMAIGLSSPKINDPDHITRALTLHFIGRPLDENLHESAVLYLKGDIPQNYFDDQSWNLEWNEAPFQIGNLLVYLSKLPEFQLS